MEDPPIDRSIDRSYASQGRGVYLLPVQGWSERARTRSLQPRCGRRDLICRWRSVNWRQSHGRRLPPFSPPCTLRATLGCSLTSRLTFSSLVFNATRKDFFLTLIRPSMKSCRATALFRNPGEAVGFCPCHLSIASRTALDPLFLDHRPRSAVIFLVSYARRANLAGRNFSKLSRACPHHHPFHESLFKRFDSTIENCQFLIIP